MHKCSKVDVFLEFLCFFCDPIDVDNLTSGSSAYSKSSLYIWEFLLKPSLKDFEHYLASVWNECSYVVVLPIWMQSSKELQGEIRKPS